MHTSLTEKQRQYLGFIQTYIRKNQSAPRLDEISKHFEVSSPTAHRALETLQDKGKLYFGRDSVTGFYIRLIEFADISAQVSEIAVLGSLDQYGVVHDFPEKVGHFATLSLESNPQDLFALHISAQLPMFNLVPHDILIMEKGRMPQVWDLSLTLINYKYVLIQITDEDQETGRYVWMTLDEDDEQNPLISDPNPPPQLLPREYIIATALRLTRQLAF